MTKSLYINGKEYLSSVVLSKQFAYSPDYISKLAREEKILATQIGKQWFAEPESVKTFTVQVEIEKKIRQKKLKEERKIERKSAEEKSSDIPAVVKVSDTDSFAQSVIVLTCSLLVAVLGWASFDEGLGISDFASGTEQTFSLLAQKMIPEGTATEVLAGVRASFDFRDTGVRSGLTTSVSIQETESSGLFTDLPEFPEWTNYVSDENSVDVEYQFSDEVIVTYVDDNSVTVQPIFKSGAGAPQDFLLVPANNIGN